LTGKTAIRRSAPRQVQAFKDTYQDVEISRASARARPLWRAGLDQRGAGAPQKEEARMLRKSLAIMFTLAATTGFGLAATAPVEAAPQPIAWHYSHYPHYYHHHRHHYRPPHRVCRVHWRHHHRRVVCYWVVRR
jgi:hypothetical protein